MTGKMLTSLIRSNQGILEQKLSLIKHLQAKHGLKKTGELFTKSCPIAGATIGAHYRHSMDHMELATLVASASGMQYLADVDMEKTSTPQDIVTLNYDLRVRGGTLERDVNEATKRIDSLWQILEEMKAIENENIPDNEVNASFMLSSSSGTEFKLKSTIGRELGFAAHHAIHHLAMVKIIATQTLGMGEDEFHPDFGKAPSTIQFEST